MTRMRILGNTRKVTRILIFPVTLNWKWLNWEFWVILEKWLGFWFSQSLWTGNEIWAIWVILEKWLGFWFSQLEKWLGFWFSQSLWTGSDSNWEFWVILEKWLGFSIFVKLAPLDWNDFYSHEFTLLTCLGVCRMNLNGTYKNWISQSLWTRVKIL